MASIDLELLRVIKYKTNRKKLMDKLVNRLFDVLILCSLLGSIVLMATLIGLVVTLWLV